MLLAAPTSITVAHRNIEGVSLQLLSVLTVVVYEDATRVKRFTRGCNFVKGSEFYDHILKMARVGEGNPGNGVIASNGARRSQANSHQIVPAG